MAILFTIYALRFAAKSATYRYGIYADVKSKSVVLKILKKQDFRFYAGVKSRFVQNSPNSEKQNLLSSHIAIVGKLCFNEICICNNTRKKRVNAVAFPR